MFNLKFIVGKSSSLCHLLLCVFSQAKFCLLLSSSWEPNCILFAFGLPLQFISFLKAKIHGFSLYFLQCMVLRNEIFNSCSFL